MINIKLEWLKAENYFSRKQYNTEAGKFYPIVNKNNISKIYWHIYITLNKFNHILSATCHQFFVT